MGWCAARTRWRTCCERWAWSFFASLKKELWHRRSFTDEADTERAVFESIEAFYNRERLHSSLGYVSPATFESQQPTHTVHK